MNIQAITNDEGSMNHTYQRKALFSTRIERTDPAGESSEYPLAFDVAAMPTKSQVEFRVTEERGRPRGERFLRIGVPVDQVRKLYEALGDFLADET